MKTTMAILAGALLGLNAQAATLAAGLTTELKYWWDFEGSNVPVDGAGTPLTQWTNPFGYTAGDSFGTINSSQSQNPYNLAVSGVNANSFTLSFAVRKASTGATNPTIFALQFGSPAGNELFYGTFGNTLYTFYDNAGGARGADLGAYSDLQGDTFKTITVTSSAIAGGTKLTYYLDGVQEFTENVTGETWTSQQVTNIFFGRDTSPTIGFWGFAEVDNVGIWNRALTTEEIQQLPAIPEPSGIALGLLGGAALVLRRRRRVA